MSLVEVDGDVGAVGLGLFFGRALGVSLHVGEGEGREACQLAQFLEYGTGIGRILSATLEGSDEGDVAGMGENQGDAFGEVAGAFEVGDNLLFHG